MSSAKTIADLTIRFGRKKMPKHCNIGIVDRADGYSYFMDIGHLFKNGKPIDGCNENKQLQRLQNIEEESVALFTYWDFDMKDLKYAKLKAEDAEKSMDELKTEEKIEEHWVETLRYCGGAKDHTEVSFTKKEWLIQFTREVEEINKFQIENYKTIKKWYFGIITNNKKICEDALDEMNSQMCDMIEWIKENVIDPNNETAGKLGENGIIITANATFNEFAYKRKYDYAQLSHLTYDRATKRHFK